MPRSRAVKSRFSTGQRKRVALARSLLHDPEVLFLDEPTSGLDPAATRDVTALIDALAAERGRTVVLCTHFLGEAGKLAHRMAVLFRGSLRAFGTTEEIAARFWQGLAVHLDLGGPADDAVQALITSAGGARSADSSPGGAVAVVADRAAVPHLVAALVAHEVPVYGALPRQPTLEDVYFAIEAEVAAELAATGAALPEHGDGGPARDGSWPMAGADR